MKKINSVVTSSTSLVDDLTSMGLFAQASVIDQAIGASKKIKSVLLDEGVGDADDVDDDNIDEESDDLEDVLEDEGVGDNDIDEESDDLPDDAVGVDAGSKYSPKQLQKLKKIANACIAENKSVKSAKALLVSIANYEAAQ